MPELLGVNCNVSFYDIPHSKIYHLTLINVTLKGRDKCFKGEFTLIEHPSAANTICGECSLWCLWKLSFSRVPIAFVHAQCWADLLSVFHQIIKGGIKNWLWLGRWVKNCSDQGRIKKRSLNKNVEMSPYLTVGASL